jgi:hypothetical protein
MVIRKLTNDNFKVFLKYIRSKIDKNIKVTMPSGKGKYIKILVPALGNLECFIEFVNTGAILSFTQESQMMFSKNCDIVYQAVAKFTID